MTTEFNKLGKTEITNEIKVLEKSYTPDDFFYALENKYNADVTYSQGEMVVYNGKVYLSLNNSNKGNTPAYNSAFWNDITNVNNYLPLWSSTDTYNSGSIVYKTGNLYISLADNNIGNDPTIDVVNWRIYSASFTWSKSVTYSVGEFVSYGNKLYYSLKANNINNIPAELSEYWELFSEYGSKVEALLITLDGTAITSGDYQVTYDSANYKIVVKHNLSGRVNGILYDENGKQMFYGLDYVDDDTISIQMNSKEYPTESKIWKLGICLGSGFSVRMVNYDDTTIRNSLEELESEVTLLRREIANLSGGMNYIGEIDLSGER